jgi:hypothetical protein
MAKNFADRLWVVRKRILAFMIIFFAGIGLALLLLFCVTHWNADPGWLLIVFPPALAIALGTFPALAYFLNGWIRQFEVMNCPTCGTFLWPTQYQAMQIAVFPRCSKCWKPLV